MTPTKLQISTQKFPINGISINTAQIGSGPILILIHGWSNSWVGWTLLAEKLAPNFKVVMIDMPGFGDSDTLPAYDLDIQAQFLHQLISTHFPHPRAIIGASLGTIVTANLIDKYPSLTNNIILLGAMFSKLSVGRAKDVYGNILKLAHKYNLTQKLLGKTVKTRYAAYFIEKYINNAYHFDRKMVDIYNLPGRRKMDEKCYVEMGIAAYTYNLEKHLKSTRKNTLIMYGASERYVTPELAKSTLKEINNPRIHLKIIPKSGHNPGYEQPSATSKQIKEFLSAH